MEKPNIKVDYDKEEDMLHLFREGSNVKFSFNVELLSGDIIIDFDFNGQIVGLEIFNASRYFPFMKNVQIEKIKAKMNVQYSNDWAQINYEISAPGKKIMSREIISPYNKNLVVRH